MSVVGRKEKRSASPSIKENLPHPLSPRVRASIASVSQHPLAASNVPSRPRQKSPMTFRPSGSVSGERL
jgi:hypothetical protein